MIAELDRYHGIVLRQLLVEHGNSLRIGVANRSGRVDAFFLDGAAFQIKHSSKRLSPWHFTYIQENLRELEELQQVYNPVWVILVCGQDGVACLSLAELMSIIQIGDSGAASVRISRSRNSMYHVSGGLGDLPRAKPRGVQPFLQEVFKVRGRNLSE